MELIGLGQPLGGLALSSSWLRTVCFWSAINRLMGGTTNLVMTHTMTAKPMSCPMNVDIVVASPRRG